MNKFLSVIIPKFKESEQDIFPLLTSIYNQLGVDLEDIEVIICNDAGGSGPVDGNFLNLFQGLEISQIDLDENKGPGGARQAGIDNAKGQYLMFCDADDILHSTGVLGALMQEAGKDVPDILASSWLEEVKDENGIHYLTHKYENTWMHGKLIRRQFLLQNNIRHHPDLRVHEDSYILAIAQALSQRTIYLDIISYVWRFNPNSITRRNGCSYTYDSMPVFIYACSEADRVIEQKKPEIMEEKITQFCIYNYFIYHKPDWQEAGHWQFLKAAEEAFVKFIKPFWHYWKSTSQELKRKIYNAERTKHFGGLIENETLEQWIGKIGIERE